MCSYEEVLSPVGFKALSIEDNEFAVGPRKVLTIYCNYD